MTVNTTPTRISAAPTTCTPRLQVPRHPRVRFALSERAARRHLEQFEGQAR
ncbi:MAG: hypothetical protein ACTHJ6_07285 [Oryzihumus sp.]